MQKTENYGLTLYDKEDKFNITADENSLNANMKIIDEELRKSETLTLGKNLDDGLIYIFKEGKPIGNGIEMGSSGDIVGYIDEDNNIVLSGELLEENYNVKYEMADGTLLDVGNISLEKPVEIINQIPISTDKDGNLYVGTNGEAGYKTGYRLSTSSGTESVSANVDVTGFIPVKYTDIIYVKGITVSGTTESICFYAEDKSHLTGLYTRSLFGGNTVNGEVASGAISNIDSNALREKADQVAFMRISAGEITDQSIITVNQPIE